jgi:hypothetical protein
MMIIICSYECALNLLLMPSLLLLLGTIPYMLVIDDGSHDNGNGDTQNAIQDSNENEQ